MKKILLLLCACMSFGAFAQTITWSAPVVVYSGSGSNLHPRVSVVRNGDPVVLWGKTDTRAYFSRWNGTGFPAPTTVSGMLTVFAQTWAGPDMATFGDTIYATMKVTPEGVNTNYSYLVHSYNGGMTFSAPVRVDNIDTSLSRFPVVTTTYNGNPLVSFMKFNAAFGDAHYNVVRSSDFGMTFSSDVLASGMGTNVCDCCPASVISSPSKTIMLFRNVVGGIRDMYAGISSDGGATFPTTMQVDNTNWMLSSCPSSGPDGVLIGDSLYTVFMSAATGSTLVYMSRSSITTMGSATSPITGSLSGVSNQNFPRIAASGNAVAEVWRQTVGSSSQGCLKFTDNISSGFPATFDTVATGSITNIDVAVAPGVVHVVWEDDNTGTVMYRKGTYPTSSTSIDASSLASAEINVYPNPANEELTVKVGNYSKPYTVTLVSTAGQVVRSLSGTSAALIIKTQDLAKGNYILDITNEKGDKQSKKIEITH